MKFYSTNNHDLRVDFQSAVFNSMPSDKGLYMPVEIPRLSQDFLDKLGEKSLAEIAVEVASALLQDDIPAADLKAIAEEAINFPAPVKELEPQTFVLELFHGPSLAFKDFGARFMSRIMAYFLKADEQLLDVLVATSGDTGGAVALGFLGVPDTRVTILYPKGKVSAVQELQLCSNGENIRAIEVEGTFDDCQALVKQAFADQELNGKMRLTSANSINIARLIPQTFYYFNAVSQLQRAGKKDIVFSVPSGNFGNIAAGLLAYRMGLPVKQFIAATNANDTVPRFLDAGVYEPRASVQTYANAMDVGAPSNWVRIMDLFGQDVIRLKALVKSYSYTDQDTVEAIKTLYERFGYTACPHTAIAWRAIGDYTAEYFSASDTFVFLSTAHPCKFPEVFPEAIAAQIDSPPQLEELRKKAASSTPMVPDFQVFKQFLLTQNDV